MTFHNAPIVVIGGGICGIMAARTLLDGGEENVLLLDRSRDLGGRMSTRKFDGATFDHGAQFFTAHSETFQRYVSKWKEAGWAKDFPFAKNGYIGSKGMTALIRQLADPIDFCVRVRVTKIEQAKGRWTLRWVSEGTPYVPQTYNEVAKDEVYDPGREASINARAVIITTPVPQMLFLLKQGNIELDPAIETALRTIEYAPCLSVMLTIDGKHLPLGDGYIGGTLPEPLHSMIDNQKKGISPIPSLTIQADEDWSRYNFWRAEDEIAAEIAKAAEPWIGNIKIKEKQVKRWTFSRAKNRLKERFIALDYPNPLILAGDAFGGAEEESRRLGGVETAALSGVAAANYLLNMKNNID